MLSDLLKLTRLIERETVLSDLVRWRVIGESMFEGQSFPILSFCIGSNAPAKPVLFITGGVHGLERIGAQLAWSLLKTTLDRMIWDRALRGVFENVRLVTIPLVNPVGYFNATRCNGNGVDLMRNAPIRAVERTPFLIGGQSYSPRLPWFRGKEHALEIENQALVDEFTRVTAASPCVVAIDFHSGFGMKDRIWFPFSYTSTPFDDVAEMHAFLNLFEQTHPYHVYRFEPQSHAYLLNGDIWDYLFLEFKKQNPASTFLPLTLEMGSWTWVRKNPIQLFSRHGAFNPVKDHRFKRTFRRHHLLFDFLLKALNSSDAWSRLDSNLRSKHERLAMARWYDR